MWCSRLDAINTGLGSAATSLANARMMQFSDFQAGHHTDAFLMLYILNKSIMNGITHFISILFLII
jgi:hypothetical protein